MKESELLKLSEVGLEVIDEVCSILGREGFERELHRIQDRHKGPYEYTDRPRYELSVNDLSTAAWKALYRVLSIGQLSIKGANESGLMIQAVDPNVMEEVLDGLLAFLKRYSGESETIPIRPVSKWRQQLELGI